MSNVQYPIRCLTFFPTFSISNCFNHYEELEKWLDEKKLVLIKSFQVGDFLCCICAVPELKVEDLFEGVEQ